jgi:hypothetical protein
MQQHARQEAWHVEGGKEKAGPATRCEAVGMAACDHDHMLRMNFYIVQMTV